MDIVWHTLKRFVENAEIVELAFEGDALVEAYFMPEAGLAVRGQLAEEFDACCIECKEEQDSEQDGTSRTPVGSSNLAQGYESPTRSRTSTQTPNGEVMLTRKSFFAEYLAK